MAGWMATRCLLNTHGLSLTAVHLSVCYARLLETSGQAGTSDPGVCNCIPYIPNPSGLPTHPAIASTSPLHASNLINAVDKIKQIMPAADPSPDLRSTTTATTDVSLRQLSSSPARQPQEARLCATEPEVGRSRSPTTDVPAEPHRNH